MPLCPYEKNCFYVLPNGQQHEVVNNFDWARNWLACGVTCSIKMANGPDQRCLVGIASDDNNFEVGVRRHPEETSIMGKDNWWFNWNDVKSDSSSKRGFICETYPKEETVFFRKQLDELFDKIKIRTTDNEN